MFYKVVEGLVPAIASEDYVASILESGSNHCQVSYFFALLGALT
jgi:hypothetical protein